MPAKARQQSGNGQRDSIEESLPHVPRFGSRTRPLLNGRSPAGSGVRSAAWIRDREGSRGECSDLLLPGARFRCMLKRRLRVCYRGGEAHHRDRLLASAIRLRDCNSTVSGVEILGKAGGYWL